MKIRKIMTRTKKIRLAHIFSVLCVIIAILLLILLLYTPLFNPGRIYYNNHFLLNKDDNYQCSATNGMPIILNGKNEFSFGHFSGMRTAYVFQASTGMQLSFSWDINVRSGNFKIVLIDLENSKIETVICDGTGSNSIDNYKLSAGEYSIRFVGDRANINGKFYISQDK